jgi:hypothetical protein
MIQSLELLHDLTLEVRMLMIPIIRISFRPQALITIMFHYLRVCQQPFYVPWEGTEFEEWTNGYLQIAKQ